MSDVDPIYPAGSDDDVRAFLDVNWREALRASRDAMSALRRMVPEMRAELPESAYVGLRSALSDAEEAYGHLQRVGRYVIGEEAYEVYLRAQVKRNVTDRS